VFSKESQQIVATDPPVSARRPVGCQEILLDPVDDGAGVDLKKLAHLVGREDVLRFRLDYHP